MARRLLVAVWHVLTRQACDRYAIPEKLATSFFQQAYKLGIENLPEGTSAREYTRHCLDVLGTGQNLDHFYNGKKRCTLPLSRA